MFKLKAAASAFLALIVTASGIQAVFAENGVQLRTAEEYVGGYNRNLFKLWIDADKNGCDTRKEVLIAEATVKPKKGKKCVLSGGKWLSPYDGKTYTKDASLDVDHVVPLAEAWRSGAWAWTAQQRQDYANDITDPRALVAVTAGVNRSKGDKDLKTWLPMKDKCSYVISWVAIKIRYTLTFDPGEFAVVQNYFASCPSTDISVDVLSGYETEANQLAPVASASPTPSSAATTTPRVTPSPIPTFTASPLPTVTASPTQSPSAAPSPSPVATPSVTLTPTPQAISPTPTPTLVKPAPIKYKNCTEARAAGVTPIRKNADPELYALNTALDGDKDGDACE